MPKFLQMAYDYLKEQETWETDWLDLLCWKLFAVFMAVLLAVVVLG